LPDRRAQDAILRLAFALEYARRAGVKILVRRDGMRVAGLIYATKLKEDKGLGKNRTWAYVLVDPKRMEWVEEPLDRINPRTGNLESCVLAEDPRGYLVLTARKTPDVRDDDDNFVWMSNPHEEKEIKRILDQVEEKDRIISSLKREIDSEKKLREYYEELADKLGSEVESYKERVSGLSMEVGLKGQQLMHARLRLQEARAELMEVGGFLEKLISDARQRGIDIATGDWERLSKSAERFRELGEQLGVAAIGIPPTAPPKEIQELKEKVAKIEAERAKPVPAAPKAAATE
jgi:hypothetical protein